METTTAESAAVPRTSFEELLSDRMSPRVYLPTLRQGSAITRRMVTKEKKGPTVYMKPSAPKMEVIPAMPRKVAAER